MSEWLPVFKDTKLDNTLRRDGIVKFHLEPADMALNAKSQLSSLVPDYDQNIGEHFYGSVSLNELALKREIHQELTSVISPFLESLLINHQLLTYFYLVKVVGEKSVLNIHQDWSIVDERKYRGYNLWIPLSDSTVENGTIYAMKGSQNFPLNIRGANIPPKYLEHFALAEPYLKPIDVKLGEALLFDSRLIHYSPPNRSETPRTAVINNIIPNSAETVSFHGQQVDDQLTVNQYAVPNDLFIHYDDFVNQKDYPNPKGTYVGPIDYGNTLPISKTEFEKLIKEFVVRKKWYQLFT